ncbi:MAG TPA: preprotein translocase subunit SecE [Candidatus Paceibacterota bacterium]|nr:preprotein translocase subunit SecE [Candidatus Paceibacterota bacterium]
MRSFISYLKNVRGEMAHVVWPSRGQAVIYTALIVLISAIVAFMLAGFDYAFTSVVNRIVSGS